MNPPSTASVVAGGFFLRANLMPARDSVTIPGEDGRNQNRDLNNETDALCFPLRRSRPCLHARMSPEEKRDNDAHMPFKIE
jgi:hypothetical protein